MGYLLIHDSFGDEVCLSDLSDGAYRALLGSMFYAVEHHTDWSVPLDDITSVSPTLTRAVCRELLDTKWWLYLDGKVLIAVGGPRDRATLMRRCQSGRLPIPAEVREFVYARDGHACVVCGATDDITLDHIWPWSRGGSDDAENLRTLCRPCNSRKGARV